MTEHDYKIGDIVSYCDKPAMVTFVGSPEAVADIVYLDDYRVINVGTQRLHYLGTGQQYLREAHTYARMLMLVERLNSLNKEG